MNYELNKVKLYKSLLPIERAAAVYCTLTCLLMLVMAPRLVDPAAMLIMRGEWLLMTVALVLLSKLFSPSTVSPFTAAGSPLPHREGPGVGLFLRICAQLLWLIRWYPDTYEFNRCFANLDHLFAHADLALFGCQPSLEFSKLLPGTLWSEAFCLGYWSYYPMVGVLVLVVFIKEYMSTSRQTVPFGSANIVQHSPFQRFNVSTFQLSNSLSALILVSFFLFYGIYIFLPVAGPQFYFKAVGLEQILEGHFPHLGTYFSTHTDALTMPGYTDGFFYRLVAGAQEVGERPTAAFPSSHIGMSTIVLLLARRHVPRLLLLFVPLWALLCCATVYIQAHYLVDAIAGLLFAPVILWLAERLLRLGRDT